MFMSISMTNRPMDDDLRYFRRRALRDAVICVGWLKLVLVCYYVSLFFLVYYNSHGEISRLLQMLCLVAIGPYVVLAVIIVMAALQESPVTLVISLWLCLLMAAYNTVLGAFGGIFFLRKAKYTLNFLISCSFSVLIIFVFCILCHDIVMIHSFKNVLLDDLNVQG